YSRGAKSRLLGIDATTVVDGATALAMADQVRRLLQVDMAVSLTGVAGPEPQDGMGVGTVFIGWSGRGRVCSVGSATHVGWAGVVHCAILDVCRLTRI